jgi:hypothetical protein
MNPRALDQAFKTFVSETGVDLETSLVGGLRAMIDFYCRVRADGCDMVADRDMLLFQWGTYDWGEGKRFEIDLVRQVILVDEMDDDAIWQLHLYYRYPESRELALLGAGDRWCTSPGEAADFVEFVLSAPAVAHGSAFGRTRPEIMLECAG